MNFRNIAISQCQEGLRTHLSGILTLFFLHHLVHGTYEFVYDDELGFRVIYRRLAPRTPNLLYFSHLALSIAIVEKWPTHCLKLRGKDNPKEV